MKWGSQKRNIFQGELTMDQLLFKAPPVPGYAQYRAPVRGLGYVRLQHPSRAAGTGAPGANAARAVLRDLGRAH